VGGGTVPLDFGFAGGSGTDWAIAIGAAKIRLKNNVAVNAPWNPIWLVLAISLMTPSCPATGGTGRNDFSSNRHPALASCLSMIFSENRRTLFGIVL
jgi:hypothetical protein